MWTCSSTSRSRSAARQPTPSTALTADYVAQTPGVNIEAVYAGSYQDTITKVLTAVKGGNPPQLSVILSVDMFTLIEEDAIVAFDDLITTDEERAWIDGFYPAFMENSQTGGKTYGIPFQRSTPVLYWNKEAFKEAGLDPDTPPANWDEMVSFGKKLTKTDSDGNVSQWGVRIPSSGFPYWLFQGLTTQNDVFVMNAGRQRDLLRQAGRDRGLAVPGRPQHQAQGHGAGHHRMGHHAQGLLRA